MNNLEKKLDALIDALGFDAEKIKGEVFKGCYSGRDIYITEVIDYKLTKRDNPQRKYNLYISALIEHQSGATTFEEFTEITKGLI